MALFQISTSDCSSHFKAGMRENGPTLFKRSEQKAMQYSSPEKGLLWLCILVWLSVLYDLVNAFLMAT